MVDTFKIPLVNVPQEFSISLADRELLLISKWNDTLEGGWLLDIIDDETGIPIIAGIPLVTGVDLLAQYAYLGLNGQLIVYTDGNATAVPTQENLGIESNLYFRTV